MECGNCTQCCRHLYIPETDSKEGDLCKYCEENIGCTIYENRPESCRIFECCWKQMQYAHIDLRPDNCGILFEKWSDYVIVGSVETMPNVLSNLIRNQIGYFQREGISVLVVNQKEKTRAFYLADGHDIPFVEGELKDRWQHRDTQLT